MAKILGAGDDLVMPGTMTIKGSKRFAGDHSQMHDVYRLAEQGERSSRARWNLFASEYPEDAREVLNWHRDVSVAKSAAPVPDLFSRDDLTSYDPATREAAWQYFRGRGQ